MFLTLFSFLFVVAWQETVISLLACAVIILTVLLLKSQKKTTVFREENRKFQNDIQTIKKIVTDRQSLDLSEDFAVNLEIKLKNRFISALGHEIRTPINGMLGLLSIIKQADNYSLEENLSIYLEIESLTKQLFSAINDLLDYIKLNNDILELDKINFNIYNELMDALGVSENEAENRRISIKHKCTTDEQKIYALGDPARFKQIITNITRNAYLFHKKNDITIECGLETLEENKLKFKLQLSYFGEKIKDISELDHFDLETNIIDQVYNTAGLSLGLNISKRLIHLMGGTISNKKDENDRTIIDFNVVFDKGLEPDPNEQREKLILLVEDNVINQKVSLFALNKLGYNVDIAPNGLIAVELFQSKHYDLILMDIQMPVMDGIAATRRIREIESMNNVSNPIGIIAITANTIKEDRERCFAVGMNEYVSKPFSLDKFPEILSKFERK